MKPPPRRLSYRGGEDEVGLFWSGKYFQFAANPHLPERKSFQTTKKKTLSYFLLHFFSPSRGERKKMLCRHHHRYTYVLLTTTSLFDPKLWPGHSRAQHHVKPLPHYTVSRPERCMQVYKRLWHKCRPTLYMARAVRVIRMINSLLERKSRKLTTKLPLQLARFTRELYF